MNKNRPKKLLFYKELAFLRRHENSKICNVDKIRVERGKTSATRGVGGPATWGSSRLSWYSAGGLFAPLHVAFEKFGEVAPLHQGNELRQHLFGVLLKAYSGLGHAGVSENGRCQTVEGVGHCATTDVPVLFAGAHGRRQLEQEMEHSFLNNALGQWFAINFLQKLPCDKPVARRNKYPLKRTKTCPHQVGWRADQGG